MNETCKLLNRNELAAITGGKKKKTNWKKVGRCALGVAVGAGSFWEGGPVGIIGGAAMGVASYCL
jgi:hypothetical protein